MRGWMRWMRIGVLAMGLAALTGCCVMPPFFVGFCGPGMGGGGGHHRGPGGHEGGGGSRHHWRGEVEGDLSGPAAAPWPVDPAEAAPVQR